MSDFRKQIEEDIQEYQKKYPLNEDLKKEEWAFNYWILDKFFYEEEELAFNKIIDNKDRGIDAYVYYEETKELYIIQSKFYTTTKIQDEYVKNNFLITPLETLKNGTYVRSQELQQIFTHNRNSDDFTIHLQIYVTNDLKNEKVTEAISKFNTEHTQNCIAEIYYLSDIEEKWYGEARHSTTQLTVTIESVNHGTILNINNEAYKLENGIDAKYVFTPVTCIYNIMKIAQEKKYALFEKNIREYLGNKGVNKGIYTTLMDKEDRKNFFYYNNGITIICEEIKKVEFLTTRTNPHAGVNFNVKNPQIVNGCQTVQSIYTALNSIDPDDLENQFKDTFVMLKVLQIDKQNPKEQVLSKNIVTYNNSQNSIDEKTFVANNEIFQRLKNEFEQKGYLLLIKQSDKNTFSKKYENKSDLIKFLGKSISRRQIFGMESNKNLTDFYIPLERILQVILAFKEGGLQAYTLKKDVLKPETVTYKNVTEFIRSSNVTTEVLLNLYLLFLRSEREKNYNSRNPDSTEAAPIPFYLIDGFSKFECKERSTSLIAKNLSTREQINKLIKQYTIVTLRYTSRFIKDNKTEYIKMIKMPINYEMFMDERNMFIIESNLSKSNEE